MGCLDYDVAVTGYTVHRGATAGFSPDGANEVGSTDGGTTTLEETSVSAGTWFYRVVAADAAGNTASSDPAVEAFVLGVLVLGPCGGCAGGCVVAVDELWVVGDVVDG